MDALLGVDSAGRITDLLEPATQILGRMPDAWGRPVDGPWAINDAEVELARQRKLRLWFWGSDTRTLIEGDILTGLQYGNRIAGLAARLGYRAGCMLGPDYEAIAGWDPTAEFAAGVTLQPETYGYAPCAYLSPHSQVSVAALHGAQAILRLLGRPGMNAWLASWLTEPFNPRQMPAWDRAPTLPGVTVLAWQCFGNIALPGGGAVDVDLLAPSAPLWTP